MNIKAILRNTIYIVYGYFYTKKIVNKYSDSIILLGYMGIGDRVFMLSYVDAFKKYHHVKKIKIISSDPESVLYQYFGISKTDIIKVDSRRMNSINMFFSSDLGYRFEKKNKKILPVFADSYIRSTLYDYNEYMLYSDVVKQIYRIPLDTMPQEIKYDPMNIKTKKILLENKVDLSKTVLINPYANSCKGIPISFFQKISDEIKMMGYNVITSINGTQKSLKNTLGLHFPLSDVLDICSQCGTVIGARSGFMDFISFSKAKIVCIDNINYPHCSFYFMENCWKQNENIETFHWSETGQDEIIQRIIDKVKIYMI